MDPHSLIVLQKSRTAYTLVIWFPPPSRTKLLHQKAYQASAECNFAGLNHGAKPNRAVTLGKQQMLEKGEAGENWMLLIWETSPGTCSTNCHLRVFLV